MMVASTIVTYSSLVRVSQPEMLKPFEWPQDAATLDGIAFSKARHRNARPTRNHSRDIFLGHFLFQNLLGFLEFTEMTVVFGQSIRQLW